MSSMEEPNAKDDITMKGAGDQNSNHDKVNSCEERSVELCAEPGPSSGNYDDSSPCAEMKTIKLNQESLDFVHDVIDKCVEQVSRDNVDSGISVDKSETNSSGDRTPHNELLSVAASSSNLDALRHIIKKPRKNSRNYRKRKPSSDLMDSDDSSRDSDDLSMEESRPIVTEEPSANVRLPDETHSEGSHHSVYAGGSSSSSHSSSSGSALFSGSEDDSDSSSDAGDDQPWDVDGSMDNQEYETPSVLLRTKPKHNWILLKELRMRELGVSLGVGRAGRGDVVFEHRYYNSLHAALRLELMYKLDKHRGCVNGINFHPEGELLASCSDDLTVVVWEWARNKPVTTLRSGHKSNVFHARFMHLNSRSQLNIATSARDGQVRLLQCPPSGVGNGGAGGGGAGGGGGLVRRRLGAHRGASHKLHVTPLEPHIVLSAGEDGLVLQADVRLDTPTKVTTVKEKGSPVALYSIHGHPFDTQQILLSGRDTFVRVYDRRSPTKPLSQYCPSFFLDAQEGSRNKNKSFRFSSLYVTSAMYDHSGAHILASYNDDDIYLFDAVHDRYDKDAGKQGDGFSHRYAGHRNSATFKGVAFWGPQSQFIMSGSDCSNIYMWHRDTEAIVQWMCGDEGGVVNCIEGHPRCPVLASSGIDKDVKIWVPSNETDPMLTGLRETVTANSAAQSRSPLFNDFLPTLYSAWTNNTRFRPFSEQDPPGSYGGNIEFEGNVCSIC